MRCADLDLTIQSGEILGVAGVEGNGQRELAEAITGLRPVKSGDVVFDGDSIRDRATIDILRHGRRLCAGRPASRRTGSIP